ncbi:MAG: hypothetical protein J6W10_02535, partial [Kiritimatiellae bacterium]|nr:hypothetical protein [Kiritimatiellia bacterium]
YHQSNTAALNPQAINSATPIKHSDKRSKDRERNSRGRTPKTLGFFVIFGFNLASRQLRRSSEGAGAATFGVVRIRLARFALPRLGLGGSKSGVSCSPLVCRVRGTIENVRASAARPERYLSRKGIIVCLKMPILKKLLTYFLNMFRTVISLLPFAMVIGFTTAFCKMRW